MCSRKCVKYYSNNSSLTVSEPIYDNYCNPSLSSLSIFVSGPLYSDETCTTLIGKITFNNKILNDNDKKYETDTITLFIDNEKPSTLSYIISYINEPPKDTKIRTISYDGTGYHYGLNRISTIFGCNGLLTISVHE